MLVRLKVMGGKRIIRTEKSEKQLILSNNSCNHDLRFIPDYTYHDRATRCTR